MKVDYTIKYDPTWRMKGGATQYFHIPCMNDHDPEAGRLYMHYARPQDLRPVVEEIAEQYHGFITVIDEVKMKRRK